MTVLTLALRSAYSQILQLTQTRSLTWIVRLLIVSALRE